jgi:tetratricopeptide (TPR) repeat protein
MSAVEYQNFELEISSDATAAPPKYFAHVIQSPGGEAGSPVTFRFSAPAALAKLRDDLESAVLEIADANVLGLTSRGEKVLKDFGSEIFHSIFKNTESISKDTQSISEAYARCKDKKFRLRLRVNAPDLVGLPWEYLYEENEVISYVSLRRPFVRYLETAGAAEPMAVKGPLRILGMISNPGTDEWPSLDVSSERARINKGIDKLQREGRVVFQWVPGGTGKDLMSKLSEQEWHIFHFIGHGGIEPQPDGASKDSFFNQSGFIVMVDEDGKPRKQFASDLAIMLDDAKKSLKLVVLNCCESAKVNVGEKFGNPAIGLVRTGWLPAVIAMQYPITDGAAISMSERFYTELANNAPVDDALMKARRFISQSRSKIEFGIPILYMRSADGRIFDVDNPPVPSSSADVPAQPSIEELKRRREEFLLAAEAPPNLVDELECFAQRGRDLIGQFKTDKDLAKRVAKIYSDLGVLQQKQKQTIKAAAGFASAIELEPENPDYRVRRASFYLFTGHHENALTDIDAAIKLRPGSPEFYWIKGIICRTAAGPAKKRGFLEQAVQASSVAVDMDKSEPKYLASRALAYEQLGLMADAIKDMDQAIEMAPDNAEFLAQRTQMQNRAS